MSESEKQTKRKFPPGWKYIKELWKIQSLAPGKHQQKLLEALNLKLMRNRKQTLAQFIEQNPGYQWKSRKQRRKMKKDV